MESLDHDLGQTISHFLNCFIGNVLPKGGNASATKAQLANEHKVYFVSWLSLLSFNLAIF